MTFPGKVRLRVGGIYSIPSFISSLHIFIESCREIGDFAIKLLFNDKMYKLAHYKFAKIMLNVKLRNNQNF